MTWDPFEAAVRAVVGQQISVPAACTIIARLAARFGDEIGSDAACGPTRLFPTPEALAEADLTCTGMPRSRGETLGALARAVADRTHVLDEAADPRAVVAALQAMRGIGPWTAEYIAMRGLGDPDAMPNADLGLLRALRSGDPGVSAATLQSMSLLWRPWRAYAAIHLWSGASPGASATGEASESPARSAA